MHKGRQAAVAPVGDCLIDQVSDEDDLCAPEVIAGPQEDPSSEEEVVQNEVGGYIGRSCDENIVLGKEVPDIAELREEEDDPGWKLGCGCSKHDPFQYRHGCAT